MDMDMDNPINSKNTCGFWSRSQFFSFGFRFGAGSVCIAMVRKISRFKIRVISSGAMDATKVFWLYSRQPRHRHRAGPTGRFKEHWWTLSNFRKASNGNSEISEFDMTKVITLIWQNLLAIFWNFRGISGYCDPEGYLLEQWPRWNDNSGKMI